MTDFVTLPLLNPRGVYDPTIWYDPNDQITYNGVPYFCRVGIINGQPITPGSDPTVWQLLSEPGEPGAKGDKGEPGDQGPRGRDGVAGVSGAGYRPRGEWSAANTYSANDSVSYMNSAATYAVMWFAIKDNTNVVPGSDPTVWGAGIKGDTGDVTPAAQAAADSALASKNAAGTSETNAGNSAAAALASKNAAGTSATNAGNSAAAALASKNAAGTSETNAGNSAAAALASKNAAGTSETNAGNSAAAALASKNAAGVSETNAGTSAAAAATSAASVGPGNPNLAFNGSGEVGVLGWSGGPTAISAIRDVDGPALLFAANASSATSSFNSQAFRVKGGAAHTFQADILTDAAATGTYAIDMNYYASADGSGSVLFDGTNAVLSAKDGAWHHVVGTDSAATVPVGANSARVRLVVTGATWTTLKLRRVKVEQSVSASPWSAETTLSAFSPNPPANLSPIFQAVQALGNVMGVNHANLFPYGSAELGNTGWGSSNFGARQDTANGGTKYGNTAAIVAGSVVEDTSALFPLFAGTITMQIEAAVNSSVTGSGAFYLALDTYTSAGVLIASNALKINATNANTGGAFTLLTATATLAGGTIANAKLRMGVDATTGVPGAAGVQMRRIKVEAGGTPSIYSNEATLSALNTGRLLNVQVLTGTGTYNPLNPSATNSIIAEIQGGGGAGAGALATTSTTWSTGIGGAAGGYIKHRMTSGFSNLPYAVGAGGTSPVGAAGNNGGNTTFGSLTAPGGIGGALVGANSTPTNSTNIATPSAAVTGGNILNIPGANAPPANGWAAQNFLIPSMGANSLLGQGGLAGFNTQVAQPGRGYGAGGGPGNTTNSQSAVGGASGSQGVIIVYEYA
jgi:hypothetical protein